MTDSADDIRAMSHGARMERDGLKRCDVCGDWSSDTEPVRCAAYNEHGTVVLITRNLCGWCRLELEPGAVPGVDF